MGFGPQNQPAPVSLVGTPDDVWQRQYGQVMPVLAASNIPQVSATTGGVGAAVQTELSNGQKGQIQIYPGANPLAAGSVDIIFPSTPPTLFIAGDEKLGPITQATNVNTVTISWTAATLLKNRSLPYNIAFMWSTSQ